MNSLASISQNDQQFLQVLMTVDPDLARVYAYAKETNFNLALLPPLIRIISNLSDGSGYGRIQIFMESRIITSIKPEESNVIKLPVVDDTTTTE